MAVQVRVRRMPPPELGPMLAAARGRAGLPGRECARRVGVSHVHLLYLERSQRCPSKTVAAQLASVLDLDAAEWATLMGAAVDDAGRDFPGPA